MKVSMAWEGGMRFAATGSWGHEIRIDAEREKGGGEGGFRPTELLLWGVAGCTGLDVVRILEKKRQRLESLEIFVEAEQDESYPRPFHTFRVHYVATGDVSEKALAQAIELSEGKYCVVSQTVQQPATVSTSFEIR